MTVTTRKRALALLAVGLAAILVIRWRLDESGGNVAVAAPMDSIPQAEKRLERVRRLAAAVPGKEAVLKQASAELATRENGILGADTAPQAQAQLLQIGRTAGKKNNIDIRGGEFGPVRALGADYGEVAVTMAFECRIEDLVNLLADLTAQPEVLATSEIRVISSNAKEKTVTVRLGLTGVVPRKLAPARKGPALF